MLSWLRNLFSRKPVRLAIVRRYADANGSYVGELYMERTVKGISSFDMVGVSLDTCSLDTASILSPRIDTANDFLALMPPNTIRVGALQPVENDRVRAMVAKLPRRNMTLVIQNRFIEHVMERKPC